tara:strand:- start:493 stop:687 length:195 start_codon:yes stop_codon:yes gene_type:complete
MFEAIMSVFIGYCIGRSVNFKPAQKTPDAILAWDKTILGYRPVSINQKIKPGQSYYICYEIKPQ